VPKLPFGASPNGRPACYPKSYFNPWRLPRHSTWQADCYGLLAGRSRQQQVDLPVHAVKRLSLIAAAIGLNELDQRLMQISATFLEISAPDEPLQRALRPVEPR